MSEHHVTLWWALGLMAGVTWLLRALPLLIRRSALRAPWMAALNRDLPLCVMVVLVLHSISGGPSLELGALLRQAVALVVVGACHLRWRHSLLSVALGLTTLALLQRL